jgi:sulfatase maturation enzyme AslB (radical SAM superfamily)
MNSSACSPAGQSGHRLLTRRGVLWVGLRCDVRCKFCYDEHVPAAGKGWLGVGEAIQALEKFRFYYGNRFVDFMGGEPTLHPGILELVAHAARIGLRPTVITHGMHLAKPGRAQAFADAGIHDFLVSIHGIGDTVAAIHGRGKDNAARQRRALDNLRVLGIPFRFNVTVIRDNLTHLEAIAGLAGETGALVVNFLTFNPYFEWARAPEIDFQPRHSEAAPYLARAIDACTRLGIEANVRYMPLCQLPGYQAHVYTGYQLPFDPHEWDYNSWYDTGHHGTPDAQWYLQASRRQQARHHYIHVPACQECAVREICDGFHAQYVSRWGGTEAVPCPGPPVTDPRHFISNQYKVRYDIPRADEAAWSSGNRAPLPLQLDAGGGAEARLKHPARP